MIVNYVHTLNQSVTFVHLVSPPVIIKQPTDDVVEVYSSITLECKVQGYGHINVEWRKLGSPLPSTAAVSNSKLTNGACSTLKITKIVGYNGGFYYCIAINTAGQTTSKHANISVRGKFDTFYSLFLFYFTTFCSCVVPCPEIIKPYKNITVLVNQAADLYCLASSCGALTYDWMKSASNLSASAVKSYVAKQFLYFDQIVLTCQLTIPNVQLSDEGWYCCLATNECGTTEKCVWIDVNSKFCRCLYITSY